MGFIRLIVLGLWLLSQGVMANPPVIDTLQEATLESLTGAHSVHLPHILAPGDFPKEGGTVRYRLHWQLAQAPDQPQGVYVSKMALSGRLYVNGQLVGACGNGPLERLNCFHLPQLFMVPAALFRAGSNQLEIEVYAASRQSSGLSLVRVGDVEALNTQFYAKRKWLIGDLRAGLAWLSGLLGLLSLMAGLILRRESVFVWFGLSSLVNAIASLSGVVVLPWIDNGVHNWLVSSARLVSLPLTFLTFLGVFAKDDRRLVRMLLGYSLLAPVLVWFGGTHQMFVSMLYVPVALAGPWLLYSAFRWTWQSRTRFHLVSTLMMVVFFLGGAFDLARLTGWGPFEGGYFAAYLYSGMMFAMGTVLVGRLAHALAESQKLRVLLEHQVAERMAYEVTENIPVGTFTMVLRPGEPTVHFAFMSRRFLDMVGLDREVLMHDPYAVFGALHPDDREAWLQRNKEAFAKKAPLVGQIRLLRDGVVRWVTAEAIPRSLPDGATLWEGVLIDDTEEVLATEAAEKDRAALQAHWLEQSRQQEREQLLRDMHDGFGSQLASVRVMVEKGRISGSELVGYLQEVSADLHLVVDTLSQQDLTLEEALYDMRYRTERRLAGSGIQFEWDLALDGMPALSPRTILQILRIVQEAMSNAIRHAEPKHITVTACYQEAQNQLCVSIRDDGKGMPEQPTHGRGLANMRHRAREIGAQWNITSGPTGTEVEVCLPFLDSAPGSEQTVVPRLADGQHL